MLFGLTSKRASWIQSVSFADVTCTFSNTIGDFPSFNPPFPLSRLSLGRIVWKAACCCCFVSCWICCPCLPFVACWILLSAGCLLLVAWLAVVVCTVKCACFLLLAVFCFLLVTFRLWLLCFACFLPLAGECWVRVLGEVQQPPPRIIQQSVGLDRVGQICVRLADSQQPPPPQELT
jgi:hypothetical protein